MDARGPGHVDTAFEEEELIKTCPIVEEADDMVSFLRDLER